MNYRVILRVLGFIVLAVGVAIVPAALLSLIDHTFDRLALGLSSVICIGTGLGVLISTRGELDLRIREGFAIVSFGWLVAGAAGGLPYWIAGLCTNPVDSFFESVSGFTTTGATVLVDLDSLPRGILLWRSLTQWVGGMGIVLLSVAVLPMLGVGGMQLFKAEVPGPTADRLSPRIQSTAKILWGVYVGITAAEAVLLMFGGMGPFEAFCHSFTTVSTGGFSTRDASVGGFDSIYVELVIIFFMFISGANFSLHYWLLRGHWRRYWGNEEFRLYSIITGISIIGLWIAVQVHISGSIFHPPRVAAFTTVSIMTTTGFGSADYLLWGFGAQMAIFVLMFLGGCAGSTAGGIKAMRLELLAKHLWRVMKRVLHPRAVYTIRHSRTIVADEVLMNVLGFFLAYIVIYVGATVIVTGMGVDLVTAMGATASTLGNVGPGLGEVGPTTTYAGLPLAAKFLLALCMVLGRLEIFTMLVVMTPMFWRKV
ncbi:MAG: TrkH family potassium uptake protein [Candidatus Eisenbacteria bacterium]|uniref:TrkH family potassium uptake protein n=1 Tax=Eiseniibacteriota bacterium TaxID=2212470 RepID=A0A956LYU4_UNCEI|nr:TrkH family potassium uptake protein [Candidatus Eisenbacteria bacterium]